MRVLVGDTGPLLHLCESDLLWILNKAGNVHVPSVVVRELKEQTPTSLSAWIIVSELSSSEEKEAKRLMLSGMLDAGEAGAICLAQRLRPDWFLTDDTAARIFAKSLGMEAHGS